LHELPLWSLRGGLGVPEKEPFSGTGTSTNSDGRRRVETPTDGPQVSPIAGNGAGGHALAAIEPLEGAARSSPSLRGPSSTTSRRRTTRRLPNEPTPMTGPTSRRSAAATASRRSQRPRRPSRSISRRWRRSAAGRQLVSRPGPSGSRYQPCGGGSPRSRAVMPRPDSRRPRSTRSSAASCAATAAPGGRPCGRRSRCSSSSCRRS